MNTEGFTVSARSISELKPKTEIVQNLSRIGTAVFCFCCNQVLYSCSFIAIDDYYSKNIIMPTKACLKYHSQGKFYAHKILYAISDIYFLKN